MIPFIIAGTLLLLSTAVILWLKDSRVFLYFWYKLIFDRKKGNAFLRTEKSALFPDSETLEANWELIRMELRSFLNKNYTIPRLHELDPAQRKISFDKGPAWRTHLLKVYDVWLPDNCEHFPATKRMLQNRRITTALFSILEPGTIIPPHEGQLDGIYRYHLGLEIPKEGECFIRVNGEEYHWKEGEGILFNDTFLHEVKNLSNEYRIVLFLDIKRPLAKWMYLIDKAVHKMAVLSPGFLKAKRTGKISIDL